MSERVQAEEIRTGDVVTNTRTGRITVEEVGYLPATRWGPALVVLTGNTGLAWKAGRDELFIRT